MYKPKHMYLQPRLPEGLVQSERLPTPPPLLHTPPLHIFNIMFPLQTRILIQPHINMKHVEHLKPSATGAALIKNESLKCLRGNPAIVETISSWKEVLVLA